MLLALFHVLTILSALVVADSDNAEPFHLDIIAHSGQTEVVQNVGPAQRRSYPPQRPDLLSTANTLPVDFYSVPVSFGDQHFTLQLDTGSDRTFVYNNQCKTSSCRNVARKLDDRKGFTPIGGAQQKLSMFASTIKYDHLPGTSVSGRSGLMDMTLQGKTVAPGREKAIWPQPAMLPDAPILSAGKGDVGWLIPGGTGDVRNISGVMGLGPPSQYTLWDKLLTRYGYPKVFGLHLKAPTFQYMPAPPSRPNEDTEWPSREDGLNHAYVLGTAQLDDKFVGTLTLGGTRKDCHDGPITWLAITSRPTESRLSLSSLKSKLKTKLGSHSKTVPANTHPTWTIPLSGIRVGGSPIWGQFPDPNQPTWINTGSWDNYGPAEYVHAMYIAIFGECEWQTQKNHIGYCLISKEAAHAKFDAGKADFVFGTPWRSNNITDVPLTSFLRETDVEDYYMGSFYGVPKQEWSLGTSILQHVYTAFRTGPLSVGFAPRKDC